ncbi:MAG: glycosyltransferase family 4 protein [Saccharolobus sp.]|uniref:glycosyltransferase family 4 protein n=1 Tax=Saccharolobus TaxID=2100760 RepID=UPI001F1128A5|nr:glycosyltransferase family 4 protein [Saccharolobus shibatae]MCH4816717.1 glycosyltransferase family 4 protein [Saccharolobus shibatae]
MRIVQVAPFYHPIVGGVEKTVKKISEFLVKKGNEVIVVTYNRDRKHKANFAAIEEINGVKVIRVKPLIIWSHGSYSPSISTIVKSLNPDILHVHVWRHPHIFQLRNIDSIRILQPHSPFYMREQVGYITFIYYKLIDKIGKNAIKKYNIISMTPLEQEILYRKFSINSELIPNGVDDELFSVNSKGDNYYLYIGRIGKEKNILTMLRAYRLSRISRPLIIAGPDNGFVKEIIKYSETNNIHAKYLGEVSDKDKIDLLSKCRALINPSPYEGFGLTLLEAQAMGKPVIIVGHGGQEFAAPPGKSSIRAENDVESLAKAFIQMEDEVLYKKLSEGATTWAKNFRYSMILDKYLRFYKILLNKYYF